MGRNRSVFINWLLSYIMVFLLPILIGFTVYGVVQRYYKGEFDRANSYLLQQVRQNIDTTIQDVENFAIQLAMNNKLQTIISVREASEQRDENQYKIYDAVRELQQYKASVPYISCFYLYLRKTDMVLAPEGRMDSMDYFHYTHDKSGVSYDEWKEMLRFDGIKDISTIKRVNAAGNLVDAVAYRRAMPFDKPSEPDATLVTLMDKSYFVKKMEEVDWVKHGIILILDDKNQVILSTGEAKGVNYEPPSYTMMSQSHGLLAVGDNVAIYTTSSVMRWKYVMMMSNRVFLENESRISLMILFFAVLYIIVVGFSVYNITKRNYRPIEELMNFIRARQKGEEIEKPKKSTGGAEYEYLQKTFQETLDEQAKLNVILGKQQQLLQNSYLAGVLKGSGADFMRSAAELGYLPDFISDAFVIVLIRLDDYSKLFPYDEEYELRVPTVQFVIGNVLVELFSEKHKAYILEVDGYVAALVNMHTDEGFLQFFSKKISYAKKVLNEKMGIYFSAAFSGVKRGSNAPVEAYREAERAMEYRMIFGQSALIYYGEVKDREQVYYLTAEERQKLINSIVTGNSKIAKELIDEIFEQNFQRHSISVEMAKCLIYDLAGAVLKAFQDLYVPESVRQIRVDALFLKDITCIRKAFFKKIEQACVWASKCTGTPNLLECVKEHIAENYTDATLSVSGLGSVFNLTPSYLSKLFREQTGAAIPEYINRIRLGKAKGLLSENRRTIGEIAVMVGYVNENVFIRTFKRHEGMTPGQYRSRLQLQKLQKGNE
ncbi:MAG: AraC family transcriptional regulator [Firmicutes bacterium]|nr:AraC family transcriptional regulator [Bacillota bacterium]